MNLKEDFELGDKFLSIIRRAGKGQLGLVESVEECIKVVSDCCLEKDKEIQLLTDENDMIEQDFINITKQKDELISVLQRVKKSIVDRQMEDQFGHTLLYVNEALENYKS